MKNFCLTTCIICYILAITSIVFIIVGITNQERLSSIIALSISLVSFILNGTLFLWGYKEEL